MALTAILLSVGCLVGKGKYDALFTEHEALKAEYAAYKSDAETAIKTGKDEAQTLSQALAMAEAESNRLKLQINQLQAEKANLLADQTQLKSSVAEMEQALVELAQRKAEADARVAEYRDLLDRFQALIDAGKLKVKVVDGRLVVELATDVLFASGSANLSKEGKAALIEVSGVLAGIPGRRYQVEGHTDNDPIATAQYPSNWELASARAIVVTRTLVDAGLPAERVSAASYGEYRPVASNDSKEGKAANRRIEIVVVPDLSSLPGFEELQQLETRK